jgi:hypothetical protein
VVATMIGGRPVHDPSSLFGSVEPDGTHGHGQGGGGGIGAVDTVGSGG